VIRVTEIYVPDGVLWRVGKEDRLKSFNLKNGLLSERESVIVAIIAILKYYLNR
jgi:hypothetical protein